MKNNDPISKVLEHLDVTQDKLADILDVSRQTLINYVKSPEKIPAGIIFKLYEISGISIDLLLQKTLCVDGPVLERQYEDISQFIDELSENAKRIITEIDVINSNDIEHFNEERDKVKSELLDLVKNVKRIGRKATVCCFGRSDAGKSTLNNFILGDDVLPTKFTPMTSSVVVIHHISEKPEYLGEVEDGVVFGRKYSDDGKLTSETRFSYNKFDIYDKDAVKDYIVRDGDHDSVINAFSTRDGAYYGNDNLDYTIDEVHVFLDIDILKEITLVDMPGFYTDNSSDNIGLTMGMSEFDLVLYLSPSNTFMQAEELTALTQILRSKELLDNDGKSLLPVFVFATQANAVGDPREIRIICDSGAERVLASMSKEEMDRLGIEDDCSAFKDHFMGLEVSNKNYMERFNTEFSDSVKIINSDNTARAIQYLINASESCSEKYILKRDVLGNAGKAVTEEERNDTEKFLRKKSKALKSKMINEIDALNKSSKEKYENACDDILDVDYLVEKINDKGLQNKKKDRESFANYVTSRINSKLTNVLKKSSDDFKDKLKAELDDFVPVSSGETELNIDMSSFSVNAAFLSGLVGISTYGALAVWASAVAAGSNLGSYILVAKIVSVLSAIGISVGGTASAAAAIAAIGGPVTIGIGLAVAAALTTFGIMSGSWKKSFAKKLIKAFYDEDVIEKGCDAIDTYWKDTETAFIKCQEKLLQESIDYVNKEYERSNLEAEKQEQLNESLKALYSLLIKFYSSDFSQDEF